MASKVRESFKKKNFIQACRDLIHQNLIKKKMKKIRIISALLIAMAFVACDDENLDEAAFDAQIEESDISSEQSADATYEEIDDIVEYSLLELPSAGRTANDRDGSLKCAEISHNEDTKTIEVLFDGTCEGPEGNVKSGKLIITYNERRYVPGSFRKVTFEDFYFNDVQVEGTRTITNISETSEDAPAFNILLEGGKLTFADGTSISRNADHTRTWLRADNPANDVVTITGEANGIRRDGTAYSSEITSPITFQRSCIASGTGRIPASGVKVLDWNDNTLSVDFGDGTCDNLAVFSLNGDSMEREINPRGLRRRRR